MCWLISTAGTARAPRAVGAALAAARVAPIIKTLPGIAISRTSLMAHSTASRSPAGPFPAPCKRRPLRAERNIQSLVPGSGATQAPPPGWPSMRLVRHEVRPHHLVVFVVEYVAVHQVPRTLGRVERVLVLTRADASDSCCLRCPADDVPVDESGEHLGDVLPARLVGVGRDDRPVKEWAE